MLRRKKEIQKEKEEQTANIMAAIEERKEKLKQTRQVDQMSEADKAAILSNLGKAYDAIDAARMMEMNRQTLNMRKRLDQRRRKMREVEAIKKKEQDKKREEESSASKGLAKGSMKGLFKRHGTLLIREDNDNSELMRKLRAWKINKKQFDDAKLEEQIQEVQPDMDDTEIATMILKLKLIQSNFKQIYAKKKKLQRKLENTKKRRHHRRDRENAPSA